MAPIDDELQLDFRDVFDHSPSGMALLDPQGGLLRTNRAFDLLLGRTGHALERRSFLDWLHPRARLPVERALAALVDESRTSIAEETHFVHPTGRDVWAVLTLTLLRGATDAGHRVVAQLLDITPRKTLEPSLEEAVLLRRAILEGAHLAIIATGPDGTIREFNAAATRMLGYTRQELVGRSTPEIFHLEEEVVARAEELGRELNESIAPGFEVFVRKARDGQADEREWTYVRKDGSRLTVRLSITALVDSRGELLGFVGIGSDVSEPRRLLEELARSRSYLEAVLAHVDVGVMLTDPNGSIAFANRSLARSMGIRAGDYVGKSRESLLRRSLPRFDDPEPVERVIRAREGTTDLEVQRPMRRVYRWTAKRVPLSDGDGQLDVYRDVTSEVDLARMLEQHSVTDHLTGLLNRRGAMEAIRREVARARRHDKRLSFVFVDVDHFKQVNDAHGHAVGDRVLVALAGALTQAVRAEDVVARWGGEEILLVLPGADLREAKQLAERARAAVAALRIEDLPQVTVSAGVAEMGRDPHDLDAALARADEALYRAKSEGRDCVR